MNFVPTIDRLEVNDIVMTHGSKVKLDIREEQSTKKKMKGYNAKSKKIAFEFDDISKIIRGGKVIYNIIEE